MYNNNNFYIICNVFNNYFLLERLWLFSLKTIINSYSNLVIEIKFLLLVKSFVKFYYNFYKNFINYYKKFKFSKNCLAAKSKFLLSKKYY